jgi:hypothetical protein
MDCAVNGAAPPKDAFGLTGLVAKPPERVMVRRRASAVTGSAWRLEVASDQGVGGIVLVDISPDEACFRGDGIFLGWSQTQLTQAYQALTEALRVLASDLELLQLG